MSASGSIHTSASTPPNTSTTGASYGRRPRASTDNKPAECRYRFFYEKRESVRFLGHLDMVEVFHRAMIAAGFPLVFSQGFNPHPRVSFGPPLPFGAIGLSEAFDIETKSPLAGDPLDVNRLLPAGLKIKSFGKIIEKGSLNAMISASRYRIYPPDGFTADAMRGMSELIDGKTEIIVSREKDGRSTQKNIRPAIISISVNGDDSNPYWEVLLSLTPGTTCKPSELVSALCPNEKFSDFLVCRVECVIPS